MTIKSSNKCKEENEVNCDCMKPSINYQKCEEFAFKSKSLYNQAVHYNLKRERYLTIAARAKCRAKELEKRVLCECEDEELEEEIELAWWEYNEFIQHADIAACRGEAFMKASLELLEKSQKYYSKSSSCSNTCDWKKQNKCNCEQDC